MFLCFLVCDDPLVLFFFSPEEVYTLVSGNLEATATFWP